MLLGIFYQLIYYVVTYRDSQTAVLSSVDSKTVALPTRSPDMLTHTETEPSASRAIKGGTNPTIGPVEG